MISYLALGDSYTIGEGVPQKLTWPFQLKEKLKAHKINLATPQVIAQTGWTTEELEAVVEKANISECFDLVTLLIGVNDQYRGYDLDRFIEGYKRLIGIAKRLAGGESRGVVALSIPDWGATPFAAQRDRAGIARDIDAFNAASASLCREEKILFVEITSISREVSFIPDMLVGDQLHPSGLQYQKWVEVMETDIRGALQ